ncbi:MAG: peptidase M14 [Candidatus Omnitrophica bacterium]|nr:peptidase M14 [Candidatus Omnitrophota bacterium]
MNVRKSVLASFFILITPMAFASEAPSPEDVLGFRVGDDFRLARWEQIVSYFHQIDSQSNRVLVEEIGRTTENAPYILAVVSSPETMGKIDEYKKIQRKISHPNELEDGETEEILSQSKTVVLVSCSLHSSEIGASQMSMELLHELATRTDDRVREILDQTIILLVPSANPDGIDKVVDWYEKSIGTPWEGSGMPWLYQKYVGHDNNRDWFMLTQKETQILTQVLYHQWHPCIVYDIHQMGNAGCRFFVPPFYDPISPNVDPLIHESLKLIGGAITMELAEEGKKGVINNAIYDNWWHGGNRTTPYRHNIIGILTEAASPRIASPVFQSKSDLSGHTRGLPEYRPQVNFADPWPGGWWRLRDVVEYEKTACYALFTLAARYRERFNRNYLALGEKAVRLGNEEPPFAYLIPPKQRDWPTAVRLLQILRQGGVDIDLAESPFTADGIEYPANTYIIFAAQPYRNHIRDLLDPQVYPDRELYPGGPAESPYDMAGWTLSYQMGVTAIRVKTPFSAEARRLSEITLDEGRLSGEGSTYFSTNRTNNDFILLNRALKESIPVSLLVTVFDKEKVKYPTGSLQYGPLSSRQSNMVETWIVELGLEIERSATLKDAEARPVRRPRIALYQPWTANMDEGWTRWVLEQFEFDYTSLHNAEIQAGDLSERYDVIVLPDMSSNEIMNGRKEDATPPQYAGGVGKEGAAQLQKFVADGGRLICLDSASTFAVHYFDLPVRHVLQGLKSQEFYCPGSILRINLDRQNPLCMGMDPHAAACFNRSYAFEAKRSQNNSTDAPKGEPRIAARYDNTLTLMSGWILGEEHLQDKAALLSVPYGKGEVVLYGFRVQHRGQPHGTFRLLFNGLLFGGTFDLH